MVVVDDNTIVEEEARDAFLRQDDTIRVYSVTTDGNYRYMHVRTGSEVYLEQYENILKVTSDAYVVKRWYDPQEVLTLSPLVHLQEDASGLDKFRHQEEMKARMRREGMDV